MHSIELEYQCGLESRSRALLRTGGTVRRIGQRDLKSGCMWRLLKTRRTRNVGYFMTAGGN